MHPYAFLFAARGDQAKTGRSFDFCYEGNGEYAPPAFLPDVERHKKQTPQDD